MRVRLVRLGYRVAYVGLRAWSLLLRPHTRGVKCVVCAGDELLLVRHSYGPRTWDLPGGFSRRGEEFLVTARREISEELDLAGPGEPVQFGTLERRFLGRHETLGAIRVDVAARAAGMRGFELTEVGWFRRDALPARRAHIVDEILALETGLPGTSPG